MGGGALIGCPAWHPRRPCQWHALRHVVFDQHVSLHTQLVACLLVQVDPQFYAFRWITLLLGQEFNFADVLRIWDTILSDPHGKSDCLLRICTAMILNIADILRNGDFTVILKTLQRYPPVDVNKLLSMAATMPPVFEVCGSPFQGINRQ